MKTVSRTAWDSFIKCKRCFYLERKLKIKPIGMPGYPINSRVDALLKAEFDKMKVEMKADMEQNQDMQQDQETE